MGFNYEKRGRAQELNVKDDGRLVGYSLSDRNINFEKHDFEDVAIIANKQLDKAEERLRDLL